MTRDELRETLALGVFPVAFEPGVPAEQTDAAFNLVDAFLAALRDAGFAIVPKEPSAAMSVDAQQAILRDGGDIKDAYRAMLTAGDLLGERGS